MLNKRKLKKGFGILEVLIVLAIICIILGALMWISRAAMANSVRLQQRTQAIYLAQEGIEIVRHMRDTNITDGIDSTTWDTFEVDPVTAFHVKPTAFFLTKPSLVTSARFGIVFNDDHVHPVNPGFYHWGLETKYTGYASDPTGANDPHREDFADASDWDTFELNGTTFRRSIYLEQYSFPQAENYNNVSKYGVNNQEYPYDDEAIHYLKVRSVVIWGPPFSIDSNNKIEVSEILTDWKSNY